VHLLLFSTVPIIPQLRSACTHHHPSVQLSPFGALSQVSQAGSFPTLPLDRQIQRPRIQPEGDALAIRAERQSASRLRFWQPANCPFRR
jgi:hypothetical protein